MSDRKARLEIDPGDSRVRRALGNLGLLLDGLRRDGVPIDTTHWLVIQEVGLELLKSDPDLTLERLKAHLKPILCGSVEDAPVFERHWTLLCGATGEAEREHDAAARNEQIERETAAARRKGTRAAWIGAAVVVGVVAVIAMFAFPPSPKPPETEPIPSTPAPEPQPETPAPQFETTPTPAPDSQPTSTPTQDLSDLGVDWSADAYPPPDLFPRWIPVSRNPVWIVGGLTAIGLLGLVLTAAGWAQNLQLRRGRPAKDERPDQLWIDLERPGRHLGHLLKNVAHRLRRHQSVSSPHWDAAATVEATIRQGGIIHPVRASRPETPEYLALVQQCHRQDHWQHLAGEWLQALRLRGIDITEIGFQLHPGQAWWASNSAPVSLRELRARFPRHRLLMFGEDLETSSSFTGEPHRWISELSDWESARILITPPGAEEESWAREMRERHDWQVVPLAENGLDQLSAWLGGDNTSGHRPTRSSPVQVPATFLHNERAWLSPTRPASALIENGSRDLAEWLGKDGLRWLRACAVYPELNWHLTQFLGAGMERFGRASSSDAAITPEPNPSTLWKLAQLPWFRKGRMPDWWRSHLIKGLTKAEQRQVRSLLLAAMVRDGHGKRLFSLEYATRHPRRVRWRGRLAISSLQSSVQKRLEETVCARVLGDRFSVNLPFIGRNRLPLTAIGSVALLASAVFLAVANWKAFVDPEHPPFPYITEYALEAPNPSNSGEIRRLWTLQHPSGITFRWIPRGSFLMGQPEVSGRKVTLTEGFWIATTEVTERQWRRLNTETFGEYIPAHFDWVDLSDGYFWNVLASNIRLAWLDWTKDREADSLPVPVSYEDASISASYLVPDQRPYLSTKPLQTASLEATSRVLKKSPTPDFQLS